MNITLMRCRIPIAAMLALTVSHSLASDTGSAQPAVVGSKRLSVPVDYYTLPNGLKVVLSRDTTVPTAGVGVYYHVGFRNEPRDRTGFAHLFEHLMFQGSREPREDGVHQAVRVQRRPAERLHALRLHQLLPGRAVAHARDDPLGRGRPDEGTRDHAANLKNQQDVVKNEVRVNVLNQPYGGFPWIDLPMAANENWYNAHNFYGDSNELDAATLEDVERLLQDVLRA